MSLSVRFAARMNIVCPHCDEVIGHVDKKVVETGGRSWLPFLERIGYYVPYERRTSENDWYGKDRILTEDEVKLLREQAETRHMPDGHKVALLTRWADEIVVNADW